MKWAKKGLSLMEVLLAIFIVVSAIGALATMYPGIFTGVNLDMANLKAWGIAQREMETLKNSPFANLYAVASDPEATPQGNVFATGDTNFSGTYYVQKLRDVNNLILDDLVKLEVVVCFKVGNRIIGEDRNLNGIKDGGEDDDNDRKITSPVRLTTLVMLML